MGFHAYSRVDDVQDDPEVSGPLKVLLQLGKWVRRLGVAEYYQALDKGLVVGPQPRV